MSISAINCTPIKPQVSFGSKQEDDYDKIILAAQKIEDSFTPKIVLEEKEAPEKKSLGSTLVSLGVAGLVMYAGGKLVASKANEVFPQLAPALEGGLKKAAGFVKDTAAKMTTKDNKIIQNAGKGISKAEEVARNIYKNHIAKSGDAAEAMKNIAGVGAVLAGTPTIATIDGNGDGISDIAQKNVNAYKSAIQNMGVVSEVIDALS